MDEDIIKTLVPSDITFEDLNLSYDRTAGIMTFNASVIKRICEASDFDYGEFSEDKEKVANLVLFLYIMHLGTGKEKIPVAEELFREAIDEVTLTDEKLDMMLAARNKKPLGDFKIRPKKGGL